MALVLVFSVQGVADALTLKYESDRVQSNIERAEFEITFSLGLKPDTTAIKDDNGKLVTDNDSDNDGTIDSPRRIDSHGYLVEVIDGRDYRTTTITTANSSAAQLVPPTPNTPDRPSDAPDASVYAAYTVHEKVSASQYVSYDNLILANSGKSAFSNRGYPLHYYTPAFTYDHDSNADTPEKTAAAKVSSQIKIRDEQFTTRPTNSDRYHYNDEAIAINVSTVAADGTLTTSTAMTVRQKIGSTTYPVNVIAIPTARPAVLSTTTASLWEGGGIRSLPSRITLTCTAADAAQYRVTITDVSPEDDFPDNAPETLERAQIYFTLYVEDDAAPTGTLDFSEATGSLLRLETAESIEPIHTHFTLTELITANRSIRYKVTDGSGLLYVGTPTREDTTPTSDLTVHSSAAVYLKVNQTDNEVVAAIAGRDLRTHGKTLVFKYTGSDRRTATTNSNQQNQQNQQQQQSNTISASPTSISGAQGSTQTLTVSAGTATVGIVPSSDFLSAGGSVSGSGTTRTITLPNTASTYSLTLSALGYTTRSVFVTVTAPQPPGTLTITTIGTRVGNQQGIRITAQRGGSPPSSALTVSLTGITLPPTVTIPAGESSRAVTATLPSATAAAILTANASGYNPTTFTIPAPGQVTTTPTTPTTTTTTTTGTAGEADSIEIEGSRSIRGTVNQVSRLRVRVTDANNRGVSNVRVTYRVLAPGRGRLSQRGNGRAVVVETDRNGDASASLTPLGGNLIVEAGAAGVSARVTFIIDVDGESTTPTTPRDTDTAPTPRTTINPDVHVGAANRPPMLWVDGGSIYALVGADVQRFVPGVDNALNIAVGGGKVYWTEQTGENSGTINSANLNGSGMTELVETRWSVPMGIAVDTARSRLYWSNSSGKIKRANLNGSGITNVMQDLQGVRDIAVARGNLYWTQYDATEEEGNIGIVNPNAGRSNARYISTGSDAPGSIAIGGNTVYWTEQTGESSGTINSANLNGSGMTELVETRWSVPMGIAVDTARSRLYWSNSSGKIKNANLTGKQGRLVVDGLGMPGDMVLSNSIAAPAKTPTTDAEQTASTSKYDINGDGAVDSKDVDALIVAVAAGVTDAKYDVNGDGKVDIFDVSAVSSKRDAGAAAAPALLGTNLSIVQIDRLQEQIDLLVASNDRSPDTLRLLTYLHQLIVMARPEKTQLLANYPNPFNPETWIPYELATDTEVRITIYNTHGVVVRTLELGHQSAGYYTGRERAAYWDGRNALGEQVASGIYFYQFETDELSSMRKMVILK